MLSFFMTLMLLAGDGADAEPAVTPECEYKILTISGDVSHASDMNTNKTRKMVEDALNKFAKEGWRYQELVQLPWRETAPVNNNTYRAWLVLKRGKC